MAPKYQLYSGFAIKDALAMAGAPRYKSEFQEGEPPVAFFTQPPKNSTAVFSTLFNTRPFRFVENPTRERQGHYWWAAEIQRVCDELRRNLPDVCRRIETPRSYWDLYKYFDAYDIYYRGAQNLWNVINSLVFENEYAQRIVNNEQRMETQRYMPLFEHLASELMRRPGIQTKLLTWDRERQQDILKVLTAYELQIFEGYEKYPDHFLCAIRAIFARRYENLRKGPGSFASCHASIRDRTPNEAVSKELAGLRQYLQRIETLDDPFMDKFAIPNKIINGIVIADGTSKTAALKAKYEAAIASNKWSHQSVVRGNVAYGSSPKMAQAENVSSLSQENGDTTHRGLIAERCSSAPSIGGDPAQILSDPITEEARVYPGGNHEVDKKLAGCPKPARPKNTDDGTLEAINSLQTSMPPPDSDLQQVPANTYQSHYYQGTHHPFSPIRQRTLPPAPNFVLGPVPSHQNPGPRDRGMSQGPFAHQIPPYAMHQHHMSTHPSTIRQTQYPRPAHIQPKEGGYSIRATTPYFQAEPSSSESSRQHMSDSSTRNHSNGKWQPIGSDDIHGPKAVFRKGSVHDRVDNNHRAGSWQRKEYYEAGRRTSTTSNHSNYHRLSNTHPQQYIQTGSHQANKDLTIKGKSLGATAASSHALNESRCVNTDRSISVWTKFDPCPCNKCNERDRTIFVNQLKQGINQAESTLERLKKHFSKFGSVDSVTPVHQNLTCVHVKFAASQSAIAAVRTEPEVQIDSLGDGPLKVNFRTGSQFFVPHKPKNFAHNFDNRDRPTHNVRAMMPHPPHNRPNNPFVQVSSWYRSLPGQQTASPGGVLQSPGASFDIASKHAGDIKHQAATQSEHEIKNTGRLSYSEMTSPVITPHPVHGLVVVDAKNTCSMASHEGKHNSQFTRILSRGNIQETERATGYLPHDMTISPGAANNTNPSETAKLNGSLLQTAIATRNSQDNLMQTPENGDSTKIDEEASIDYGTVRIRPAKARYMAIPPAWRPSPSRDERETGSQYLEVASQCGLTPITKAASRPILPSSKNCRETGSMKRRPEDVTASSLHESVRNKVPADNELPSGHPDPHSHVKRKASETDADEEASNQSSLKKQFSGIVQPSDSQPRHQRQKQQVDETGKTKGGKKKKNKNRQNQATQPSCDSYTAASFAAHTFQPAISASPLPSYPPQHVQRREGPHSHGPVYVGVSQSPPRFSSRLDDSEPFPAYRDLMSGPQFPQGHRSHAGESGPNRSMSSNASTIIHIYGFSPRNNRLNPGAQNFVPSPTNANHKDSTLTLNPPPSAMPKPQEGSHAFGSAGRSFRVTQDITTIEGPQPLVQTRFEKSDSNISVLGHRAQPSPGNKVEENKGETENPKGIHSKDETALKATSKDDNASKANTSMKQGGGKRKGKSKNAKTGRNDQKTAAQPQDDRQGKSAKPIGSKDAPLKKVAARANQYAEVLKQNLPIETTNKQHTVAEPQPTGSSKQGGAKDAITNKSEKAKGKEIPHPENKPVTQDVVTVTAAEAKTRNGHNDEKVRTCPEDPGTAKASETKKPKQGKAKNRAPKKGVGTQEPPIDGPSTTTGTNTHRPEPSMSKNQAAQQAGSQSGPAITDPAPSSHISPERKPRKSLPALAPIPLYGAWRTVSGKKMGTQTQTDVRDVKVGEERMPDEERKGG